MIPNFSFENPNYLILLIIIPLLILIHFFMLKKKRAHALKFANFDAIAKIKGIDLISKNISLLVLTVIILILLIFSLSGLRIHRELETSSFSIVLAIDSSSSMEADDILPTRLEAAKETASYFIDNIGWGSKVGVISFSGNSMIETDLTDDKVLAKRAVRRIEVSPLGGTDLYEAILTSSNLLEGEEAKLVILLSDGRINVGTVDDVILLANKEDVIIHTIGIGTVEGGQTRYAISKLDEDSLTAIAYNTGGQYFNAKNKEQIMESFKNILEFRTKKVSINISNYLLFAAVLLLFLEYILINTKYKTLP